MVIADMEAGLEHLSIGTLRYIDALLVVVQPTAKTMMTARRAVELARQLGIPDIAFIANRVSGPRDQHELERFASEHGYELLVSLPEDDAVRQADMRSQCLLDVAPDSGVVGGVRRLADALEDRFLRQPTAAR